MDLQSEDAGRLQRLSCIRLGLRISWIYKRGNDGSVGNHVVQYL